MPSGALSDKLSPSPLRITSRIEELHPMHFNSLRLMNQLSGSNYISLDSIGYTLSSQTYYSITTIPSSPFSPNGLIKMALEINSCPLMHHIKIESISIAFRIPSKAITIQDFPNL